MADYRKLRVWDRSTKLAETVFKIAGKARKAGHVKLADQMEGSSESIGSNIAEGSGFDSRKQFSRYLTYSIASSCEIESQLKLAYGLHLIEWKHKDALDKEIEAVRKMLTRLRKRMDGDTT
jgi:four helix bundle protein